MPERIAWLFLAAIHFLPGLAALRSTMLTRLYGIAPGETPFLLVQHRAVMFIGVLFACLWAAFAPETRRLAAAVTAISMLGFLLLYWRGGAPEALRTIALVDLIGLPVLAYVAWRAFNQSGRG